MPTPSRQRTPETIWLSDQDPTQKATFLNDFTPKDQVHKLKGLKYPVSNANAVTILLKCQTNNKFLKRIQGKESSEPLTKTDDLAVFQPEGKYGPTFFNKKTAIRLLNLSAVYSMTSRSRRSAAKLAEEGASPPVKRLPSDRYKSKTEIGGLPRGITEAK